MKILVLNYEYPPLGGGGGRLCAAVCEGLAGRGHQVRVITAGLRGMAGCESVGGVHVERPQTFRRAPDTCSVPEMALYLFLATPAVLRCLRSWRPHVIHAHFVVPTGALARAASLIGRCPYVLTAHLGDVPGGVPEQTNSLFRWAIGPARWIWHGASATTAVSAHVASLAAQAYGTAPRVILNGIPAQPAPTIETTREPVILWVGRMSIQKNPVLAVRCLAQLREKPWRARFLGDGPLASQAEAEARATGLAGRVEFLGWQKAEDVRQAMRSAHILLMSSSQEGLPMAAVEALWHGLAIVSTQVPGTEDIVEEGVNGAKAQPDPEALAAALQPLLDCPETLSRCRHHSWQIAQKFDFQKTLIAYEEVLRAVANVR